MQVENLDGSRGPIEVFNPEKLSQALNRPEVKEVHVFKLEPGMIVEIGNKLYKVLSLNSKGKRAVLHLIREVGKKKEKII